MQGEHPASTACVRRPVNFADKASSGEKPAGDLGFCGGSGAASSEPWTLDGPSRSRLNVHAAGPARTTAHPGEEGGPVSRGAGTFYPQLRNRPHSAKLGGPVAATF